MEESRKPKFLGQLRLHRETLSQKQNKAKQHKASYNGTVITQNRACIPGKTDNQDRTGIVSKPDIYFWLTVDIDGNANGTKTIGCPRI